MVPQQNISSPRKDGAPQTVAKPTFEIGPFQITPAHLFTIASIPFGLGAYSGYHSHLKEAAKEEARAAAADSQTTITNRPPTLSQKQVVDGRVLALRALSLATMISVGGFATLGAATFYICGFRSFEDAFLSFRRWGANVRKSYDMPLFDEHPDFNATKGMSEGEEWNYIQKTYLQDDQIQKEETDNHSR